MFVLPLVWRARRIFFGQLQEEASYLAGKDGTGEVLASQLRRPAGQLALAGLSDRF
jgi:hypothetical protein